MSRSTRLTAYLLSLTMAALVSSCTILSGKGMQQEALSLPAEALPVYTALKAREASFLSLRAITYASLETMAGTQSMNIAVILQAPRSMRLEFISPAGLSSVSFTSDGKTYQYLDLDKKEFHTRPLTEKTLKEIIGVSTSYDLLWQALAGQLPFPVQGLRVVEKDERVLHAVADAGISMEVRSIYDIKANLPLERVETDQSGLDLSLIRFGDFQAAGEYFMPRHIIFANSHARVSLRFQDVIVNDMVDNDAFFLTPPWDTR